MSHVADPPLRAGRELMVRRPIKASALAMLAEGEEDFVLLAAGAIVYLEEEESDDILVRFTQPPMVGELSAYIKQKDVYVPFHCGKCGIEWPRNPLLEVACPKCHAGVGVTCAANRPSGHRMQLGTPICLERDFAAVDAGKMCACANEIAAQMRAEQAAKVIPPTQPALF